MMPQWILDEFDRIFELTERENIEHDDWYYQKQDENELRHGG